MFNLEAAEGLREGMSRRVCCWNARIYVVSYSFSDNMQDVEVEAWGLTNGTI